MLGCLTQKEGPHVQMLSDSPNGRIIATFLIYKLWVITFALKSIYQPKIAIWHFLLAITNSKSANNVDDGNDYMIYFDDNIDEDEDDCVIGVGKLPWCHPLGSLDGNQAGAGCP